MPSFEITPELIEKLKEINANTVRDVRTPDTRRYYFIMSGSFACAVSFQDAKTIEEAFKIATEDPLQPWYVHKPPEPPTVIEITHSQYVAWLRR